MKVLFSKHEVLQEIDSNINNDSFQFYKTPLVKEITQYPYSNLVFINSAYEESQYNDLVAHIKKEKNLSFSRSNNVIKEILNPNNSVGMIEFIVKEFKNNPLVTFLKFISFIKI